MCHPLVAISDASYDWGLRAPSLEGRGGRRGLEMSFLSIPVITFNRLPIVTIGLSISVFAVTVTDRQTDGQTEMV